ncbi:tigger transposable element-derived protein 1-like [Amia ocellicauda]|uniref:tigger transposable element-derived protein 1-like n=1 Tax=Amia ocellicauda TaxID=2972642 RepID=UPI003464071E
MEKMERLLITWIEHQNQEHVPLSTQVIKEKALDIYERLQHQDPEAKLFLASAGWFERFKMRHGFHNLKVTGEGAAADQIAADEFSSLLQTAVNEGDYDARQVFNIDETGLFWKRMPSRSFLSVEENSAPGFKAAKDQCTLLLGANAAGDHKLKPLMVYHSENPHALKGYAKGHLPVHWRANQKGWITGPMFVEYFSGFLHLELKAYCDRQNLPFKILLLLDNCPRHPVSLAHLSDHIKVMFLPPNTTSLIQPMDHGIIKAFKSYYLRRTLKKLVNETDSQQKISVKDVWRSFNIKMAIDLIGEAWDEVPQQCLNGVWQNIWPAVVNDFRDFAADEVLTNARHEIVELARTAGFDEVNEENVAELLESHREELSNEDLLELDKEREQEESVEDERPQRILSVKGLAKAMKAMDTFLGYIDENDPNRERSAKVARNVKESIACYTEILREKQRCSVQSFIRRQESSMLSQLTQSHASTSGLATSSSWIEVEISDSDE